MWRLLEQVGVLTLRRFVTSQVLLRFRKDDVLTELWAVLTQTQLFSRVLSVLGRVINTFARFFAHHTNNFSLVAFFRHGEILGYTLLFNQR